MRYLVDTHIFIWWLEGNKRLKNSIRKIIEDKKNQILVSVISGIEISIKHRIRKVKLKTNIERMFKISGFDTLSVNLNHVLMLDKLHFYKGHKDPFDRILISQAKVENLILITADSKILKYKVSSLKA